MRNIYACTEKWEKKKKHWKVFLNSLFTKTWSDFEFKKNFETIYTKKNNTEYRNERQEL